MNLTYTDTSIGYQHGQTDMILTAYLDGKEVGTINYSIYEGEPSIKMLEVNKEYRRMGIGTKMVKHLQKLFPDQEINIGMLTPDGSKLAQTINRTFKDNPQYKKTKDHYEQVKSEIQRIMSKMDKGDYSEADKLNDLHDQEYELGEKLTDMKTGKYFIERRSMRSSKLNLLVERLIREEIRKSLLREGTLNLDEDVDYIFENGGFKQFYNDVKMGKFPDKREILRGEEIWFKNLNSSELPSETAKKAHAINPVTIRCGISFYESPEYLPYSNQIKIYIHGDYFQYFYQDIPKENFNQDFFKRYMSYINSPSQLKGTIYHELSHWIRDSIHSRHIKKHLDKVQTDRIKPTDYSPEIYANKVQRIFDMGEPDSYMTNVEIDAMIHDIVQKKRDTDPDRWNEMTMTDLIEEIGVINSTYKRVSKKYKEYIDNNGIQIKPSWRKDWAKEFVKMLIKRMRRENLLGSNMRKMN